MTAQYYLDRAAEARRDAEAASLANVRDRCLRSEAAFLDMASRAERGARLRAKLDAEKAAKTDDQDSAEEGAPSS